MLVNSALVLMAKYEKSMKYKIVKIITFVIETETKKPLSSASLMEKRLDHKNV